MIIESSQHNAFHGNTTGRNAAHHLYHKGIEYPRYSLSVKQALQDARCLTQRKCAAARHIITDAIFSSAVSRAGLIGIDTCA